MAGAQLRPSSRETDRTRARRRSGSVVWLASRAPAVSYTHLLPLLLVPPAVGVMVYAQAIWADFWAVVGALALSVFFSMLFVGWLMQRLIDRKARQEGRP